MNPSNTAYTMPDGKKTYRKEYLKYHDGREFNHYVRLVKSRYKSNQALKVMMRELYNDDILKEITCNITDTDKLHNKQRHAYVNLSKNPDIESFLSRHGIATKISDHDIDNHHYALYSFRIEDIPDDVPDADVVSEDSSSYQNTLKDIDVPTDELNTGNADNGILWKKVTTDLYGECFAYVCPYCDYTLELTDGNPLDNSFYHCPKCGKRLIPETLKPENPWM